MKIILQLFVMSALLLNKCSNKNVSVETKDSIGFEKAEYKRWVGGISGGGAGFSILLTLKEKREDIVLEKVVFRNWIVDLHSDDSLTYYASINDGTNDKPENSLGWENNESKASKKVENLPIDLEGDETIIYYKEGKVEKFLKLSLKQSTDLGNPRY